jgi:hypothetical protein
MVMIMLVLLSVVRCVSFDVPPIFFRGVPFGLFSRTLLPRRLAKIKKTDDKAKQHEQANGPFKYRFHLCS